MPESEITFTRPTTGEIQNILKNPLVIAAIALVIIGAIYYSRKQKLEIVGVSEAPELDPNQGMHIMPGKAPRDSSAPAFGREL